MMLSFLGFSLLFLAMLTSAIHVLRPEYIGEKRIRTLTMMTQIAPFVFLTSSFMIEATSLKLVSEYVGSGLPLFYRISAVWGSRAGPLLMWASFMGIITGAMSRHRNPDITAIRVMHAWTGLILLVSAILQPFSPSEAGSSGEISPLLQTDLMVIHPPIVFVYYSLCLATASVAIAGVIRRRPSEVTHHSMVILARFSLLAGTVGIGLGGLWAYTVLDWGGYWAWDPVETGSLLPWLALLAIVHARSRGLADRPFSSSPAIGILAGALVMHATLVTRANGVWASVHAFVGDGENSLPRDPYVRVIETIDATAVGFEILFYLVSVVLLLSLAVLHLLREQKLVIVSRGSKSLMDSNKSLALGLLIYFAIVGIWIGSSAVLFIGLASLVILVNGDKADPPVQWVASGVLLMLFSSWGWITEWYQSLAGIAPFMLVWVMPEEDKDDFHWIRRISKEPKFRTKAARSLPWYLSIIFLLLTWILLTVEIDGTNILAHEYYGAPLLSLVAVGLAIYSIGSTVSARKGIIILAVPTVLSICLAYFYSSFDLPGNPDLPITNSVSRGSLSMFILTWLAFAVPPTFFQLWRSLRDNSTPPVLERLRSQPAKSRLLGSHLAHAGILLLLIGHVMTTTLVDRTDQSHFVTLHRDEVTRHQGLDLVFTGVEMVSAEDDDYSYSIGDGYVGVVIEVRQGDDFLGQLTPGMLRFDSPSGAVSARSEVDRMSQLTGDTIVILDFLQSNELLSSMIMGQTDQVDEVRVTVHHLPGSHLVWSGWVLVMIGTALSSIIGKERSKN